ncbi:MAG: M23 family metallopeptidase [Armatimonadota bacterium]
MRPTKQARIRQIVVLVLTLSLLSQTLLFAAPSSDKRTRLQKQLAANQSKQRKLRSMIRAKREAAQGIKRKVNVANAQVRASRSSVLYWRTKLERTRIELHNATIALARAKREFAASQQEASRHLVALYQRGEPGYLELMLASDDFGTMIQRSELAQYMMEQDREVLARLKDRKESCDRYQNEVDQKKREVASLQQRAEVTNSRNLRVRNSANATLQSKRAEMDALEAELAALERDSNAVASMLRSMQRSGKGRARYNGPRYAVGGLPVAGRISSGYGYRMHPILKYRRLHTGIDISAPTGTPIHAAGGGEVIWASWRGGYGNTIIIDHGGGKATLYAHMSRYNAGVGKRVSKGDVIGYVGSTGLSTGPHLHYEVRINGTPVNPL